MPNNQPTNLKDDPSLHRFTVVFDREGYSPIFLAAMKKKRIACLTYHKHPGEDWPRQEFFATPVRLASGQIDDDALAERGTRLSNQLWLREIRKLSPSGRQTAILSTDYQTSAGRLAPAMFARWSQENFFRYMRQSYSLDSLVDYGRRLFLRRRGSPIRPIGHSMARSAKPSPASAAETRGWRLELEGEIETKKVEAFTQRKSGFQEDIEHLRKEAEELKASRSDTAAHYL